MIVEPSGGPCGATVRGVDLAGKLDAAILADPSVCENWFCPKGVKVFANAGEMSTPNPASP